MGGYTITVRNQPTRSTQPCIPLGSGAKSSTSFGWVKGWNVTSAGWQVTLYDPIWHVSSSSGVATLVSELLYPCTITYSSAYDCGKLREQQADVYLASALCYATILSSDPSLHNVEVPATNLALLSPCTKAYRRNLIAGVAVSIIISSTSPNPISLSSLFSPRIPFPPSYRCISSQFLPEIQLWVRESVLSNLCPRQSPSKTEFHVLWQKHLAYDDNNLTGVCEELLPKCCRTISRARFIETKIATSLGISRITALLGFLLHPPTPAADSDQASKYQK